MAEAPIAEDDLRAPFDWAAAARQEREKRDALRQQLFDILFPDDPTSKLQLHAREQLHAHGLDGPDADYEGMLADAVLELVKVFAAQGHSGASAALTLELFTRLMRYEDL